MQAETIVNEYRLVYLVDDPREASQQLSDLAREGFTAVLSPNAGYVLMARPAAVTRLEINASSVLRAVLVPMPGQGNGAARGGLPT